jgi:NAD(P)H-flavin reductase
MNPGKPVRARIIDIRKEAEEIRTYSVAVKESFHGLPGQFNMVGYPGVGEAPVSFSSLVRRGVFEHTIKSVGRVTGFLHRLKKGDPLYVRGPYGKGWPVAEAKGKNLVVVAGGVGLAPLRPLIHTVIEERGKYGDVSLVYGARNNEGIIFRKEFFRWEKQLSLFLTVDEISLKAKWKHNIGPVTDLLEKIRFEPQNTLVFVCGPEIMMRFVCHGIVLLGVPEHHIYVTMERRMKCGFGHCGHCQHHGLFVCRDGPVFQYGTVRELPDGLL